jgi:hypothetical protein
MTTMIAMAARWRQRLDCLPRWNPQFIVGAAIAELRTRDLWRRSSIEDASLPTHRRPYLLDRSGLVNKAPMELYPRTAETIAGHVTTSKRDA